MKVYTEAMRGMANAELSECAKTLAFEGASGWMLAEARRERDNLNALLDALAVVERFERNFGAAMRAS